MDAWKFLEIFAQKSFAVVYRLERPKHTWLSNCNKTTVLFLVLECGKTVKFQTKNSVRKFLHQGPAIAPSFRRAIDMFREDEVSKTTKCVDETICDLRVCSENFRDFPTTKSCSIDDVAHPIWSRNWTQLRVTLISCHFKTLTNV